MRLTDDAYDDLTNLVLLWLPGLSCLLFIASYIWDFPSSKQLGGAFMFMSLFIGVCLTVSKKRYIASGAAYDGQINISTTPEGIKRFTLDISSQPEILETKEIVRFKVEPIDAVVDVE